MLWQRQWRWWGLEEQHAAKTERSTCRVDLPIVRSHRPIKSPFSVAVRMRYLPRFVHETRGEEQADQSVTETNKQTEWPSVSVGVWVDGGWVKGGHNSKQTDTRKYKYSTRSATCTVISWQVQHANCASWTSLQWTAATDFFLSLLLQMNSKYSLCDKKAKL